jgi:hypothetical protein
MGKMCAHKFLLLLVCLAATATPSARETREPTAGRAPGRLYRVRTRAQKSGRERTGFIDGAGRLVIGFDRLPEETEAVGEFSEGRAVFFVKKRDASEPATSGGYLGGYIDETGRVVVAPRYYTVADFSEGLAFVTSDDFEGFIDRDGGHVFRADYMLKDFHEGLAAAGRRGTRIDG